MAKLETIDVTHGEYRRVVIMVKTDIPGLYQPLVDASGTAVGFDEVDLFDPEKIRQRKTARNWGGKSVNALRDKAMEIARKCERLEGQRTVAW
jgi:hypothetical protein